MKNCLKNIYYKISSIYVAYVNVPFGLYCINKKR